MSGLVLALLAAAAAPQAAPSPAPAKARQPLTHEALWHMKRVGAPSLSPDGRWVVFPVTEPAYDDKKEVADLWIVPADGSAAPRRLTSSKGGESGAAWSADGRRLAFTARREDDEVAQVYVIDVAGGGEARRVGSSALAARAPQWSPDGKWLLFQTSAWPGAADMEANKKAAAERKDAKSKVRVYETFPIRRWDRWLDEARPRVYVMPAEGEGAPRDLLAGSRLAASPGFGGG
ncbi:MAG TPA: S9 family peptidase, partial [Vicinamibacteria bacterium]|nr:S9 family peptidase [Vicinamibacteria bacterium]